MSAGDTSRLTVMAEVVQRSQEWHDARCGLVTASAVGGLIAVRSLGALEFDCPDCGAAVDASCMSKVKRAGEPGAPIKTPHSARTTLAQESNVPVIEVANTDTSRGITAALTAERITGHVEDVYVSQDMLRGQDDEPFARQAYAEHHAPVTEVGFMVRTGDGYRIGYSPDGLVGDDGLIEIKSRRQKKHVLTILADQVPAENMMQCQAGLLVSGRKWLDYVSFSGGMALWVKRVYPDQRAFDAIEAAARKFEVAATEIIEKYSAATEELPITNRTPGYADMVV